MTPRCFEVSYLSLDDYAIASYNFISFNFWRSSECKFPLLNICKKALASDWVDDAKVPSEFNGLQKGHTHHCSPPLICASLLRYLAAICGLQLVHTSKTCGLYILVDHNLEATSFRGHKYKIKGVVHKRCSVYRSVQYNG